MTPREKPKDESTRKPGKRRYKAPVARVSNTLLDAKSNMTAMERKIFFYAVSKISKEDQDFKPIILNISEIKRKARLSGNSVYANVRTVVERLLSQKYRIDEVHPDTGIVAERTLTILTEMQTYRDKQAQQLQGAIGIVFHPSLKPYLLAIAQKGNYTRLNSDYLWRLKSDYAVSMYVDMMRHYNMDTYEWSMDWDHYRVLLGVPESKATFSRAESAYLTPALAEIREKLLLHLEIEVEKKGHSRILYFRIRFRFDDAITYIAQFDEFMDLTDEEQAILIREARRILPPSFAKFDDVRLLWERRFWEIFDRSFDAASTDKAFRGTRRKVGEQTSFEDLLLGMDTGVETVRVARETLLWQTWGEEDRRRVVEAAVEAIRRMPHLTPGDKWFGRETCLSPSPDTVPKDPFFWRNIEDFARDAGVSTLSPVNG